MLFLDEVFPKWNQEKDTKDTSKKRRKENLSEVYSKLRVFVLKDE